MRRTDHKRYSGPSKYMPIKLANEFDQSNEGAGDTGDSAVDSIDREAYVQECIKAKPAVPETWDNEPAQVCRCWQNCLHV